MVDPDPKPPRRRIPLLRKLLYALILLVVLAGLGLVGLEVYLRANTPPALAVVTELQGMFEKTASGDVMTTPGWVGDHTVEGRVEAVRLNSLGMRSPELPATRPTDERRVLVLGDSFVWGYGVAGDETIPARLEAELNERLDAPVRTGNAGAPSYGPAKALATYRHLAPDFGPDAVLLCMFLGNDFEDDLRRDETVLLGHRLEGPTARFVESSFRARLSLRFRVAFAAETAIDRWLPSLSLDRSSLLPTDDEQRRLALLPPDASRRSGRFLDRRATDPFVTGALQRLAETIGALRDAARPAPLLVAILPTMLQVEGEPWTRSLQADGLDPDEFELGLAQRRIVDVLAAIDVPCVDLLPRFLDEPEPLQNWQPVGRHLTARGNRRVGEWLAPRVATMLDG